MSDPAIPDALDWIAVDWGTSALRAWALDAGGNVLAHAHSQDGMGTLSPDGYEPTLLRLAGGWLPAGKMRVPVVVCGMAGARQGWSEAAYRQIPCPPVSGGQMTPVVTSDTRLDVSIVPGLCQTAPPDVMRGEETQLAGLMQQLGTTDAIVCMPGTHSKWAQVEKGRLTAFRTYATGDLFAAARKSAVFAALTEEAPFDASAFREGVKLSATVPLARALFQTRSRVVTGNMRPEQAYWFLSGLTIGAELQYELEDAVAPLMLLAEGTLRELYEFAFGTLGRPVTCVSSADATRAGLTLALQHQAGA